MKKSASRWRIWSRRSNSAAHKQSLKSLSLSRRPQDGKKSHALTIIEIKNGKKTESNGTWTLTGNNQVIEMKVSSGERAGKTFKCKVLKSTPRSMTIEFDGKIYALRKNA